MADEQYNNRNHKALKAAAAVVAVASLGLLSGLILAGTLIGLVLAIPMLVSCGPVLVPAAITIFLLSSGFVASGAFGVATVSTLCWAYRYVTGNRPPGADQLDYVWMKLAMKGKEIIKGKAERYTTGSQAS